MQHVGDVCVGVTQNGGSRFDTKLTVYAANESSVVACNDDDDAEECSNRLNAVVSSLMNRVSVLLLFYLMSRI